MDAVLQETLGSDLTVVNAARASFAKASKYEAHKLPDGTIGAILKAKDVKLINYLAKHKHFLPFRHPQLSFRVKAPIFVARQLVKHQVGMSWSEESRRYITDDVEYYVPNWRQASPDKKQGSLDVGITDKEYVDEYYARHVKSCGQIYEDLLNEGVAPEQARIVLPQSMYTNWVWTGSLLSFSHVYKERTHESAQKETQILVKKIGAQCAEAFPHSWKALMDV